MASHAALEMPIIIKRKQINENEAEILYYCMYTRACTYLCQFESYKNILIAGSLQNIYTTYLSQEDLIHRNSSLKATINFLCKKKNSPNLSKG